MLCCLSLFNGMIKLSHMYNEEAHHSLFHYNLFHYSQDLFFKKNIKAKNKELMYYILYFKAVLGGFQEKSRIKAENT